MAVLYHCSCVAPSLVKIAKPRRTPPGRWRCLAVAGGEKRPGFGQGPGRTMITTYSLLWPHGPLTIQYDLQIMTGTNTDLS